MRFFLAADFHVLPRYYKFYSAYEASVIWLCFGFAWEVV